MKTLVTVFCAAIFSIQLMAADPVVSEKALKNFKTAFSTAENIVWSEDKDVYTVRFTQNGIRTTVVYTVDGDFLGSHRYYNTQEYLPTDIVAKLTSKFPGKSIFGVVEYIVGEQVYYYIKMQDETSWFTIKVNADRGFEVTEKFLKG